MTIGSGACTCGRFAAYIVFLVLSRLGDIALAQGVPPSTYSVTVTITGAGTGVVSSTAGHSCARAGGVCAVQQVPAGTSITFTASAGAASRFNGWGGACSGQAATCTASVPMSPLTVSAEFVPNVTPTVAVVEYRNTSDFPNDPGGHFFYSNDAGEQTFVDGGGAGKWARTGRSFKTGGPSALCRFYGSVAPGPNSHFFTVDAGECSALRAAQQSPKPTDVQQWNYEGNGFSATPATGDASDKRCSAGTLPVFRAYNNAYPATGPKNKWDSNHRFSTVRADLSELVSLGWRDEGVVFCVPE
jgi:hypothetical protein